MDGKDMAEGAKPPRRARRLAATGLVVSGLLAGGVLAGSQVANAATLRCRIGTPPTVSSCLGCACPNRRPRPAAAMMAATCTVGRFYPVKPQPRTSPS